MCKVYGYCRISTKDQSIERQERNIKALYPDAIIVREAYTGTKISGRKEFEKLMKVVKAGDTVVFDSVSRMSRNSAEGFELYERWFTQGVNLVFIKEPYVNTATYRESVENQIAAVKTGDAMTDDLMAGITAALNRYMLQLAAQQIKIAFDQAEKEVKDLHERTREGMETARLNGKQIGQQQGAKLTVKKAAPAKEIIMQHSRDFNGTLDDAECMKLTGLARNTYYKYKRELREAVE